MGVNAACMPHVDNHPNIYRAKELLSEPLTQTSTQNMPSDFRIVLRTAGGRGRQSRVSETSQGPLLAYRCAHLAACAQAFIALQ